MSQSKFALPRNGFTFKQFFVAHDRCAMKVGTDGILLGAWAPIAQVKRVLDIGAGSGLLALMLAQRTGETVIVDAVELDEEAAAQAQENAADSPWAGRLQIHQADIQQWQAPPTPPSEHIGTTKKRGDFQEWAPAANPALRADCQQSALFCRWRALRNLAARAGSLYFLTRSCDIINLRRRADYGGGIFLRRASGRHWKRLCATGAEYGLASASAYRCCGNGNASAASGSVGFFSNAWRRVL